MPIALISIIAVVIVVDVAVEVGHWSAVKEEEKIEMMCEMMVHE